MICECDTIRPKEPEWEEHYDNCKLKRNTTDKLHLIHTDGTVLLANKHLKALDVDFLYHLGMDTSSYDLPALFGDVKFVCMGGTKNRMREFAEHMRCILTGKSSDEKLTNLSKHSHRYAMYKYGPVLSLSHGIGIPSMTVALQEIIKLLHYAKSKNPIIIRLGTCGGLGLKPGSVVVSSFGMNGIMEKCYELPILGETRKYPSIFDKRLSQEIQSMSMGDDDFETVIGGTLAADDFYRGQGRTDGPFCDHTEEEKLNFLKKLSSLSVKNIEMEATAFAAMCSEAGLRAADVCVTLIDRLQGDQVSTPKSQLLEWQKRPMYIVGRYITLYCQTISK